MAAWGPINCRDRSTCCGNAIYWDPRDERWLCVSCSGPVTPFGRSLRQLQLRPVRNGALIELVPALSRPADGGGNRGRRSRHGYQHVKD